MTEQTRPKTARCRGCGAEIIWALTEKGKRMPLDAAPSGDGDYVLRSAVFIDGDVTAVRVGTGVVTGEGRHRNHWWTCPERDRFRRTRR